MIGKVLKHSQFKGLAKYLTKGGRGTVLLTHGLASSDPIDAAQEMEIVASLSRRCKRPGLHLIVSYSSSEAPSPSQMQADAARLIKAVGCQKNQWYAIRHEDGTNPHFHLSINRIGLSGKAVSDSNIKRKIEKELRQIEAERGWTAILGRHAPDPRSGRRFEGQRNSLDPRQYQAPEGVRQALLHSTNWQELRQNLGRHGWRIEIVDHGKGRRGALLHGPDGEQIGAGKISRDATLSNLRRRLGRDPAQVQRDLEREEAVLRRREERKKKQANRARTKLAVTVGAAALAPFLSMAGPAPTYRRAVRKKGGPRPRI